jgi:hypothetical protein
VGFELLLIRLEDPIQRLIPLLAGDYFLHVIGKGVERDGSDLRHVECIGLIELLAVDHDTACL